MIQLASMDSCTGCSACKAICPHDAIVMNADQDGFLFPAIRSDRCRECHWCEKTCPVLHPHEYAETKLCLAACSRDDDVRRNSSSGGVFHILVDRILSENGCVFGCVFDGPEHVIHRKAEDRGGLAAMQGSKYLQSDLLDSFRAVKKELEEGRKVLFSGCPCQIAGLKRFLGAAQANLITMDVICHGVPALQVWHQYLLWLKKKMTLSKIRAIEFRNKNSGWQEAHLLISADGTTTGKNVVPVKVYEHIWRNPFTMAFLYNLCLRPSCYRCVARGGSSGADITVGDFWGIESVAPDFDDDKGVSAVIIHSETGKQLFEDCSSKLRIRLVSLQDILRGNRSYLESVFEPPKRSFFMDKYHDAGNFSELVNRCVRKPLLLRIINRLWLYFRKIFYSSGKEK